jgi:hypothetical protein
MYTVPEDIHPYAKNYVLLPRLPGVYGGMIVMRAGQLIGRVTGISMGPNGKTYVTIYVPVINKGDYLTFER